MKISTKEKKQKNDQETTENKTKKTADTRA